MSETLALDADEQSAMDDLLSFMRKIHALGLKANDGEMVAAIHVLQGFIVQHMLHRMNPDDWASWYEDPR